MKATEQLKSNLKAIQFDPAQYPGVFVVFCGSDGSGKTTQIVKLRAWAEARGKTCLQTTQPTQAIRDSYLFKRYIHEPHGEAEIEYRALSFLTVSDRIQHSNRVIRPALERGEFVISDRYFFSALANLRARGYENDSWIYEVATWVPKPDLAVFMAPPFEKALERVRARPEEANMYVDEEFERRLHDQFGVLPEAFPHSLRLDTWRNDADACFQQVLKRLEPILASKADG